MSLVVWLPLNGNSENQGTKQYKETMNTLEYTSNGKTTNKCMNLGRLQYDKNPLGMVGSICFWIYPKSTDEGSNGKPQPIFGDDKASNGSRKWTLYLYSSQPSVTPHNTSLHSWGCQKDGSNTFNGSFTLNGVLKESAWNHVCVVHDLDYEYVYINGILKNKTEWDSNGTFTFDVGTPIIYGDYNNYESNYRLNDFRIYNHCLTQSEVSEIAKGLMLHYSFENPYAEETTNIPHSLVNTAYVSLGSDDTGNYFIKNSGGQGWNGLSLQYVPVTGGNYYTWSLEVNPTVDLYIENQIEITDSYVDTNLPIGSHCYFDRNLQPTSTWEGNDKGAIITSTFQGNLPKNTWTKVWFTVYVVPEVGSTKLFHHFCPQIPTGDTSLKIYYRNSLFEEKNHPTPYTSSNREAGLIRDNSGMGNDGAQVYQREEIPITPKTQTTSSSVPQYGGYTNVYDSNLKTYTINNFSGADNQTGMLGTIKYLSRYHYLNSKICYEFDIKLQDITVTDGKTIRILQQGPTVFKDDTCRWLSSPVQGVDITSRLNNGATGVYHVCIERIIDNTDCVTNADYYEFGLRFDYVKSGTVTVSNLHAYYGSLDASTLSITDNSAVGTHSAYFNGKNYIDIPDMSLPVGDLTISFWGKYDINNLARWGRFINFSEGLEDTERLIVATDISNNRLVFHYVDKPDNPELYTPLNKEGWHLYTWIINNASSKMSLYIDGEFESEEPINVKHTGVLMKENYIGKSSFKLDSNLYGYIDDVRLYATALSSEDIKALYNVKTKIDNKSNLYCNQLVETKSENMMKPLNEIDLDNDLIKVYTSGTFSYKDSIIKYTISSQILGRPGMYIKNSCYGGRLVDNKRYKYSFWVKVSKKGTYFLGEERVGYVTKSLESGKWYYIEREGLATGVNANFIIYNDSKNYVSGDTIEIRDVQIYRLYDDENYNPGPNIKGQYKTFELNETFNEDVENSGATIVDKYGAEWLEVFYHDNNNCKVFFDSQTEALHTNSQYKFSILDQLEKFRGNDSKFEFLLEYPTDIPSKYNRWKQTDNPVKVLANNTYASGYDAIHVDWSDNHWGGLLRDTNSNFTLLRGSIVNANTWFFAIGACGPWDSSKNLLGVPGPYPDASSYSNPNGIVHDIHLYVRIDNLPNKNEIFRQYKRQTKTKEIIEI